MSEEKKLKAKVDEYFEKYWSVSFDKFLENWEEMEEWSKHYEKEIERLHSIIKEVRECVEHYAIENDDYTKLYSAEEQDILKLLDKEHKQIYGDKLQVEKIEPINMYLMKEDFRTTPNDIWLGEKINEIIDKLNKGE